MEIHKIAVVGGGTMGSQIAMQAALCGFTVGCYSRSEKTVKGAKDFADGWFTKSISKGKISQEDADAALSRLLYTTELAVAVKDADLVIEAVADVLKIKREILAEIDGLTPDHTIFASNSSYIVSSKFADAVSHPDKVLNLHFFNPALVMKLVEVVRGPHCSEDTVATMLQFVKDIKRVPALVNKEIYGFIVNRIFSAITKEACYMYDQGVATYEDIDNAVKYGLSHPMGPFELLDMTGIDLEYDVLTEKYRETGNLADKPSPTIVEHYVKGQYGRKTKQGFYSYE